MGCTVSHRHGRNSAHSYQIEFVYARIPLCSLRPLRRRCIVGRALQQADCCHVAMLRGSGSRSYSVGVHYGSLLLLLASCAVYHHCPALSADSRCRSMIDTRVALGNVHVSCRRGQLGTAQGVHIPTNPSRFRRCVARGWPSAEVASRATRAHFSAPSGHNALEHLAS